MSVAAKFYMLALSYFVITRKTKAYNHVFVLPLNVLSFPIIKRDVFFINCSFDNATCAIKKMLKLRRGKNFLFLFF